MSGLKKLYEATIGRFLKRGLGGKIYVGSDKAGNKYYKVYEGGSHCKSIENSHFEIGIERREIEWFDVNIQDRKSIPPEWHSWLHYKRQAAPTAQLSEALEAERERRRKRAEEWDREQKRIIAQEMALKAAGKYPKDKKKTLSMEYILEQVRRSDADPSLEELAMRNAGLLTGKKDTVDQPQTGEPEKPIDPKSQLFKPDKQESTLREDIKLEDILPPLEDEDDGLEYTEDGIPKIYFKSPSAMSSRETQAYFRNLKKAMQSPWAKKAFPPIIDREKQRRERKKEEEYRKKYGTAKIPQSMQIPGVEVLDATEIDQPMDSIRKETEGIPKVEEKKVEEIPKPGIVIDIPQEFNEPVSDLEKNKEMMEKYIRQRLAKQKGRFDAKGFERDIPDLSELEKLVEKTEKK